MFVTYVLKKEGKDKRLFTKLVCFTCELLKKTNSTATSTLFKEINCAMGVIQNKICYLYEYEEIL